MSGMTCRLICYAVYVFTFAAGVGASVCSHVLPSCFCFFTSSYVLCCHVYSSLYTHTFDVDVASDYFPYKYNLNLSNLLHYDLPSLSDCITICNANSLGVRGVSIVSTSALCDNSCVNSLARTAVPVLSMTFVSIFHSFHGKKITCIAGLSCS